MRDRENVVYEKYRSQNLKHSRRQQNSSQKQQMSSSIRKKARSRVSAVLSKENTPFEEKRLSKENTSFEEKRSSPVEDKRKFSNAETSLREKKTFNRRE